MRIHLAQSEDAALPCGLIGELAEYEKAHRRDQRRRRVTREGAPRPGSRRVLIAEANPEPVGYEVFFTTPEPPNPETA